MLLRGFCDCLILAANISAGLIANGVVGMSLAGGFGGIDNTASIFVRVVTGSD